MKILERTNEYLVIDDFYRDPHAVRALALRADYAEKGELSRNVPGIESRLAYYSDAVIEKLEQAVGRRIVVAPEQNAFGRFRLGLSTDQRPTRVHSDNTDWTAVVYLTPDEHCEGGTSFFRHLETGLIGPPDEATLLRLGMSRSEFDRDIVLRDSLVDSRWQATRMARMKFNRCVILRGKRFFHASENLFGTSFADGRLTQNFFFDEVKE